MHELINCGPHIVEPEISWTSSNPQDFFQPLKFTTIINAEQAKALANFNNVSDSLLFNIMKDINEQAARGEHRCFVGGQRVDDDVMAALRGLGYRVEPFHLETTRGMKTLFVVLDGYIITWE